MFEIGRTHGHGQVGLIASGAQGWQHSLVDGVDPCPVPPSTHGPPLHHATGASLQGKWEAALFGWLGEGLLWGRLERSGASSRIAASDAVKDTSLRAPRPDP